MDTVDITIEGNSYELAPSFNFIKRLKKALGSGSLIQIQMAAIQLDVTVVADVLEAALRSKNIGKYSADDLGEMLIAGGISCLDDGDEVGGKGAAAKLLLLTLDSFTSEGGTIKNESGTEKNA